ncbi:MAG: glycosyltransferase [Gammaproteobacteria bacterium]|nr:glycosyltransferase [Gammaproteobacteria bacterium]
MSKKVLLVWELGAGFGHVKRLVSVAHVLASEGWQPSFALRCIHTLPGETTAVARGVFQAPEIAVMRRSGEAFRAVTYADIMGRYGYASEKSLGTTVAAWDSLLDVLQPSLVVADYSPTFHLSAFGRVPLIAVGTGFTLPPCDDDSFPAMRDAEPHYPAEQLLENAKRVQRRRRLPEPSSLTEIMGGQHQFLGILNELDVYKGLRTQATVGPLQQLPDRALVSVSPRRSLFFYLAYEFPPTQKLLSAIADSGIEAEGFVRDIPSSAMHALRRKGMTVHDRPVLIENAVRRAGVVLHHGGIGTSEKVLALGRPQILLPRHLEQTLNAKVLLDLGVGRVLRHRHSISKAMQVIRHACHDEALWNRAWTAAGEIERATSVNTLLQACSCVTGS